ncbi:VanZ family protein [Metabacillus niabensis]|uniref:Glycopeptide antibiotics resistance protein n=2 Tax=Metabacillus niabensis TaxID=324854 RepID=A0ABT9Z600_9BACI|nr:VanZ family protein [Metabacillus niabensis]MDQ0227681.1 glycopeptide antibiotics resistance protein [Metabacillus niabensis]
MKSLIKIALFISFCIYLLVLTKLVLFKYISFNDLSSHFNFKYNDYYWHNHNFIPFKTISYYLFFSNDINFDIRFDNITGNIIGFTPYGFILPLLSKRFLSIKRIIIATFCLSLSYEVFQLMFKFGSFDIDDLILNTFGGFIGYIPILMFQLFSNMSKKPISKSASN